MHAVIPSVRAGRFGFELATLEDESALREFGRGKAMPGSVRFVFEREPDYFAALRVEGRETEVLLCREGGSRRVVATGHRSIKPLFVNGEVSPAGYLGGLRLDPSVRNGRILARGYEFLRECHADGRAPFYLTTIMEDNEPAKAILLSGRAGLPRYHDFGRYCCMAVSLQRGTQTNIESNRSEQEMRQRDSVLECGRPLPLRTLQVAQKRQPPPRRSGALARREGGEAGALRDAIAFSENAGINVRRATVDDGQTIVEFLRREGRSRQFFPEYEPDDFGVPGGLLSHLAWEDVFLAHHGSELAGIVAAWDQRPIRQWRIAGYAPWLHWLRRPLNLVARLRGMPSLPRPAAPLDYFILSLICIRHDDRAVFTALLDEVMRERRSRHAFFLAGLHERDPLLPELLALPHVPLPSRLYVVAWPDGEGSVRAVDRRRVPYLELGSL